MDFIMFISNLRVCLLLVSAATLVASCTSSDTPTNQVNSAPSLWIGPSVYPSEDATGVSTATAITAYINPNSRQTSTVLDESTLDKGFVLVGPSPVSGSYTYDPEYREIIFIPDQPLQPYTQYMGTFTTDIANTDGVHPEEGFSWSFTTGRSIIAVSVNSDGVVGNAGSSSPDISDDGNIVAFYSQANNLVPEDGNRYDDVFVRNIETGQTTRVSINPDGSERTYDSQRPAVSGDGRFVAFESNGFYMHDIQAGVTSRIDVADPSATGVTTYSAIENYPAINYDGRYVAFQSAAGNLTPQDTTGSRDIFLRDTVLNTTSLISVSSSEVQATHHSYYPSISQDGRFVAFTSYASNLVSGDTNGVGDIFVRDVLNGTTSRASIAAGGIIEANGHSYSPIISSNGRYVAFSSDADNLVPNDFNGERDVFLYDYNTGIVRRVSVDSSGIESDRLSHLSDMSADGRYILFSSQAMNWLDSDITSLLGFNLYMHDTMTGVTKRVFRSSSVGAISADGKYMAVAVDDWRLEGKDSNYTFDVYRARLYPEVP